MKNLFRFGLAALVALSACKKNENVLTLGEFASLTGTTATFGQSMNDGVQLALEEVNKTGGLLGKQVEVIVEDDQSKPEEARTAVLKLIKQNQVKALIGEVASSRSLAAAPEAQKSKIPMISPASTNPKVTEVGDYIFRACFVDTFQGSSMARFAFNDLGLRKVAILYDIKNDYSVGLMEFFEKTFKELGGEIVAKQSYSEGDIEFRAQLTDIKSAAPQAIYVPGYYTEVGLIARQARDLGLNVPLMGGDGWDSPKTLEIGGAAVEGSYFSNHYSADDPSPVVQDFIKKYQAKFGKVPDAMAVLGYDAANILFDAIKRAGSDEGPKIRDALAATKDFQGVTGSITMDAQRNAKKKIVILKIEGGKVKFHKSLDPA
ncbi:ABC transporter substrate-binding protein [Deltaproteobacteria bacterium PRO3]|nr:ABC transporter substrate-binding protein [Deltaproteobacteria bacterium PRO3]